MAELEFVHLSKIQEQKIIDLMNNEMVGKQLPLLGEGFSAEDCRVFLKNKQQLWAEHGFGPWAILIRGEFAGWGGLQPEQGEVDFALVLHPRFWGWGRKIFKRIKDQAFNQMNLTSITVLLPPSRQNSKVLTRLGFADDGHLNVDGETFERFRLTNSPGGKRQYLKCRVSRD